MGDSISESKIAQSSIDVIDVKAAGSSLDDLISRALKDIREPVILRGFDIGPCLEKWTPEYLIANTPSEKMVKIHKSKEKALNFRNKNFVYDTVSFRHLVCLCSGTKAEGLQDELYDLYWYLRSIGEDPRGKDVSNISVHFPTLAKDLKIPDVFPKEAFFSSVFRITSPGLQLWTHYDTCDNILIQVKGRKRVVFFPPNEALNLYLDGDKSEIVDIDSPDFHKFPKFKNVKRREGILEEGDIVFIPALWFHNITALDFSISVNVFWKNLSSDLYDKKDPYGNKDLIPAQLGYRTLEKIIGQLQVLPSDYQDFYIRRMMIRLQNQINQIELGKVKVSTESDKEG